MFDSLRARFVSLYFRAKLVFLKGKDVPLKAADLFDEAMDENPIPVALVIFAYPALIVFFGHILSLHDDFYGSLSRILGLLGIVYLVLDHLSMEKSGEDSEYFGFFDRIEGFARFARKLTWDLRVAYALVIGGLAISQVEAVSHDLANKLVNKEMLVLFAFTLTPLVTWISIVVKKDIELGKLKESWCNETRAQVASFIDKSFSIGMNERNWAIEKDAYEGMYKKSVDLDDMAPATEALKEIFKLKERPSSNISSLVADAWGLELKLSVGKNSEDAVNLREKILDVRRVALEKSALEEFFLKNRQGNFIIKVKSEYLRGLDDKYSWELGELVFLASKYFDSEWKKIKGFDRECKKTILMLLIVMSTLVVCYSYIFIKAS